MRATNKINMKFSGLIISLFFGANFLVTPIFVYAQVNNYPGGIIDININKQSSLLPEVKYGIRDATVIDLETSWRILLGIDLTTLPGEYLIYIKRQSENSSAYTHKFEVRQQSTKILNSSSQSKTAIYHQSFSDIEFENTNEPALPLSFPAEGLWPDQFGYVAPNIQTSDIAVRNYISLTTTELLTVTAPQNAIVSRIAEINPGNNDIKKREYTLYLDHGRGLYSVITGITDLTIEAGNGVQAGAVLGKIHSNGISDSLPRELIWQTILNGAYINPIILTQL